MDEEQFKTTVRNVPKNRAVFEVVSIPSWASGYANFDVKVGDICYSIHSANRLFAVYNTRTKKKVGGLYDNLKFLRYEQDV